MKRFFNERNTIVTEAMEGTVRVATAPGLMRADGFPHTKFAVQSHWDKSKVAVISGGGAGHEPAHIGFVGRGMLTAAVSGDVFASPSVEAVLSCILTVTGEAGCLLIVKNYTGDRLNFGLAAERAKNMGLNIEMVIVADDVAIPDASQPRGIAGTLFVHKLAGYLADTGASLATIKESVQAVLPNIFTLGLSFSSCMLPDQSAKDHDTAPELGLGIHGEPGIEKIDISSGHEAVNVLLERLAPKLHPEQEYCVLINNLGSVTPLEMSILTNELLNSSIASQIKLVLGPAALMTSLNMYGFSLSFLPLSTDLRTALQAPVEAPAWPKATIPQTTELLSIDHLNIRMNFAPSHDERIATLIETICNGLIIQEGTLNELDAKVGDGDTGTTVAEACREIIQSLKNNELPLKDTPQLSLALGQILANAMGGSSGVLLSTLFTSSGLALSNGKDWPSALMEGIRAVQTYGGAQLGDRTMLDALIPAMESLCSRQTIEAAAKIATTKALETASVSKTGVGRSSYLRSDSLEGVVDPGAMAVAFAFQQLEVWSARGEV